MNSLVTLNAPLRCRTVFISDVHLGFPGCSAQFLGEFLDRVECDTLYLVGDIFDFWYMRRRRYWPETHSVVVHKIMDMARNGTRVVFVPGNHDEVARAYDGMDMGNIEIRDQLIHETSDGRNFLVMHGDQFDSVVRCSPWLAKVGCAAYSALLQMNTCLNARSQLFGLGYWSLAAFLKHKVKNAVQYISSFEEAVVREAARHEVDGVICGHIHRAEISQHERAGVHELWRLGGKLHGAAGAPGRQHRVDSMARPAVRLKVHRSNPQGDLWEDLAA